MVFASLQTHLRKQPKELGLEEGSANVYKV